MCRASSPAPALVVMMMITLRKSALRPLLSVSVPWSITCSRMLKMSGCAFSISSSSSTLYGCLVIAFGQLAALVEADVARRRADQPRHRVPLHVLGHVEAQQLDAQAERELARDFRLADAGGAAEQEVADRLARIAEARARHADGRRPARRSPCPGRTRRSSGRGRASSARCGRRTTRSWPGCARSWRRSPRPRSCR